MIPQLEANRHTAWSSNNWFKIAFDQKDLLTPH